MEEVGKSGRYPSNSSQMTSMPDELGLAMENSEIQPANEELEEAESGNQAILECYRKFPLRQVHTHIAALSSRAQCSRSHPEDVSQQVGRCIGAGRSSHGSSSSEYGEVSEEKVPPYGISPSGTFCSCLMQGRQMTAQSCMTSCRFSVPL